MKRSKSKVLALKVVKLHSEERVSEKGGKILAEMEIKPCLGQRKKLKINHAK